MKKMFYGLFLAILLTITAGQAQTITISVEKSGGEKFVGESNKAKFAGKSELAGYIMDLAVSRTAGSGMATGRRTHQPLTILKASGSSSPLYFKALVMNEQLQKVVIDFYKTDPAGAEVNYYTVTLENVFVSGYKQFTGPLDNERFNPGNNTLYDEIKLAYRKITVLEKPSQITATDDWNMNQ